MSEKLLRVIDELKKKYPKAETPLNDMVFYIKWMKDRANWCQYGRLVTDGGNYRAARDWAFKAGDMSSQDILKVFDAETEFLKEIESVLKERCGCK